MKGRKQHWMHSADFRLGKLNLALSAILLLGLTLRLWGINFGLPYTYAPDEPTYLSLTLRIIQTGDLNPRWWYYPSLMFYLNAAALLLFFLAGRLTGAFTTLTDLAYPHIATMGVGKLDLPGEFLVSRGMVALVSTAAIILVYLIGRRLHSSKGVAVVAALLFAVSPTIIDHSHRFGPDLFALFFSLAAFYFSIRIIDEPKLRYSVAAGLAAGLAIASKYNAGLILVPLILAHFLRSGISGLRQKEFIIGMIAVGLAFVVAVPFSVFDLTNFWAGVQWQFFSYSTEGHAGQEGNALQWYISYLLETEGVMVVLAGMCGAYYLFVRQKKYLVLLCYSFIYFIFVSLLLVRNARTIMMIIPFLDLLAAVLVVNLYEWLNGTKRFRRVMITAIVTAICALMIAPPLQTALAANISLTQFDGRESARQWLDANLPVGARVAEEAYSPYLDPNRFVTQGFDAIVDHPPEWYTQNNFEYLVLSQGMYKRFFDEPARYGEWIAKYNQFFTRFPMVARFDDNNYEVRVYQTGAVLPAQRVAARFGDDGNLIELIGYDHAAAPWLPGEPLRVTLDWGALRPTNEPLELDLQLLGQDGRVMGTARGDLFQDKSPAERFSEGTYASEWTIPSRPDAAPGVYALVVNVIQTRYNYRTPIQNWAGQKIETLSLGPFKQSGIPPTPKELQSMRAVNVRLGDQIALLGYVLPTTSVRAGDVVSLTIYWQSLVKPTRDYTVFVHLLNADGHERAHVDAQPHGGMYPTSIWAAGEIIRDDYALQLSADLAPGAYRIEVGMYEYPSLARIGVSDANGQAVGDHWLISDLIQLAR